MMWGQGIRDFLDVIAEAIPTLEESFGIPGLSMETVGGGYHLIPPGGYLAVHTDFSRSPKTRLYRRLNLIVYLNRDWQDKGGRLQLWDDQAKCVDIAPEFNRTVVFATSSKSWHGHPIPAQRWRRSVAAYFYSPEPPEGFREQLTVWHDGA
jgi:Rps23 Pro-64 3,4-dihydroxylase Tpa1-like proline 4-hydroxylase